MLRRLTFLLALPLLCALPTAGRRSEAYFSLSTNETFLPGDKVSVRLSSTGVSALEFRVYKVNDPALFFERLGDPHTFNRNSPEEHIEAATPIERFHDWKHRIWSRIRNFFREQFSDESREKIREAQERKANPEAAGAKPGVKPPAADLFAQVPVLNSSQLVLRWRQEVPSHFYYEREAVPIDSLGKGVYLVEATNGELRAYTIVIVSELGIITKMAPGQILTFAVDRRSGVPVSGADVRVWSDAKEQSKLRTDADGLAETSLAQGQYQDVRIVAVHGADVAILTPYAWNLSSNPAEDITGYIYTDRPIYRPGHTVHFKVILREHGGDTYQLPPGKPVQVEIQDPSGKSLLQTKLALSSFGTVHGDFTLGANAALGYYSIFVTPGDSNARSANGGFHVEEYKKPEYEVKVTPSKARVLQGDEITATIEAKYYFGEPVAGASVKYVVHTSSYWSPFIERDDDESDSRDQEAGAGDSESGEQGDYYYEYDRQEASEQSGKLDADGKLTVRIPTKPDERHRDLRYRIEARVTDDANREISGVNFVVATYGSCSLGVSTESYLYKPGDKIVAIVVARDYDGHPVRTPVRVDLVRERWVYPGPSENVVASQDAQTGEDGSARVTFTSADAGSFILKATAKTPEDREVNQRAWLWIPGGDFAYGSWGEGNRRIRLIADKKFYKVGDTAHVLIMTGIADAHVLVTTEGRNIHSKKVVHAKSETITVDVPIRSNDQPNIFVAATFLNDSKLYESARNLKVPATQTKLHIEIERSKDQFQPEQKAGYTIIARDANGKPVAGEFSLGIVDEAIYAIAPEASGDIHDFFYATVYDRVSTEASLSYFFNGEAGKKQMFLAWKSTSRTALAQLKPSEALVEPKVRKDFPDTALWLADVRTDANGRAHAELNFPDSLTTWRATVRGVTADTKVGSAVDRVIVRKNLMVRLAVPRFFRQGDEVVVSTIVHNYLATSKTVHVSLAVKGLDILDGQTREIEVPRRGEAKLDWRVRAQSVAEADLLAKALTNEESDALELTLPVIPFGVKLTDAKSGSILASNASDDVTINLPGNSDQSAPTLDVTLSSSVAGSLFGALDYLTSYPYGCTEQTMSSFLPDIVVAKAMKDLHLQSTVDTPELEKKIAAGIERLKGFQHDDGGWGWWKDDESRVFMTAYVVSGFGQAHEAGYNVDPAVMTRAEQYLVTSLERTPNMEPNLQAYVIYALALNNASKPALTQAAWEKRDLMKTQGLAMLGLALQSTGDTARAKEVADTIASKVTESELEAYWPSTYDYFMGFEFNDSAETTAYAVQLLGRVEPASPLLPKAAFWLVNHRDGGYFWVSTKETAMVIFGLTDYVKASHELDANFKAEVSINGKPVLGHQFTSADSFSVTQPGIHLSAAQLHPGANTIRVSKSGGAGRLYWSASGHYYSNEKRVIQQNTLSLNITRDYYRLSPEQVKDHIVYRLEPLSGELHVGDVVAVRVTVAGSDLHYLLIEDPIPAGAESIARDELYEFETKPAWWERWYVSRELHDDRAAFFQTDFYGRHHEYVYLLKIVNPGKFNVSPAMVQPMYQPSVQATTDAATIEVK